MPHDSRFPHDDHNERTAQVISPAAAGVTVTADGHLPCSFTFTHEPTGTACRVVPEVETYRIVQFSRDRDRSTIGRKIFRCVMHGSRGGEMTFYLSEDDLEHNMTLAARHLAPPPVVVAHLAA